MEIATAYIAQYGENNVSPERIEQFYSDNSTSPTIQSMRKSKVEAAIKSYANSKATIAKVRDLMTSSPVPFQQQLDSHLVNASKIESLKNSLLRSQPLTQPEYESVKLIMNGNVEYVKYTQDEQTAYHKAQDIKSNYLYNLLFLNKLKKDAVVHDKDAFDKCVDAWRAKEISPWSKAFSNTTLPTEQNL